MALTAAMNAGAHGHIHELLGGAWSSEWSGFYNRTEEIVLPITHNIVVRCIYIYGRSRGANLHPGCILVFS